MHTHDCIHEHLPRLASQRTPQRYVAPEKAATAEGGGTAQALRIHVSAESLSSDPGRACFAEGESYSPFEGGDEYTCASADVITAAKRAILLEQLMPQATSALSRLLRVQRRAECAPASPRSRPSSWRAATPSCLRPLPMARSW